MRKRRYGHQKGRSAVRDVLIENINLFWLSQKKKTQDVTVEHSSRLERARLAALASCETIKPDLLQAAAVDPLPPPTAIHNFVGTARLATDNLPLDLHRVSRLVPNMVFSKQKFAAITVRLSEPLCTVLLFTSGKMVLTGCKTYMQCILAALQLRDTLRGGFPFDRFEVTDVCVQNIVGNSDLELGPSDTVDLDGLMTDHRVYCTYLKNMFPGLIYRPPDCPVVLLIFKSGKVVITGGRSVNDIEQGWRDLWPVVSQYVRRVAL